MVLLIELEVLDAVTVEDLLEAIKLLVDFTLLDGFKQRESLVIAPPQLKVEADPERFSLRELFSLLEEIESTQFDTTMLLGLDLKEELDRWTSLDPLILSVPEFDLTLGSDLDTRPVLGLLLDKSLAFTQGLGLGILVTEPIFVRAAVIEDVTALPLR